MAHVDWECKYHYHQTPEGRTVVGAEELPASGWVARLWRGCSSRHSAPELRSAIRGFPD